MMLSVKKFQLPVIMLAILFMAMTIPACAFSQKFVAIATEGVHTLALADDGSVWEWGNMSPDPGLNRNYYAGIHQVPISDVVAIAAGPDNSLALKRDGTVWAWGDNYYGQLGDGTIESRYAPVQVLGLSNVTEISAGSLYSVALKSDGTVWTWGYNKGINNNGRLGDGTIENRLTPVRVKGLANVKNIMGPCFAIKDDGTVWAWGSALNMTNSTEAFQVPGLKNIKAIDMDSGYSHALFVKDDGTVWSWGYNDHGEFGNGTFMRGHPYFAEPFQAKGLTDVKSVSAGSSASIALKDDGTVWAWGHNSFGELGTGSTGPERTPVMIQGLDGVAAISLKSMHSVFLKEDGSIWACGDIGRGQMGDRSTFEAYIKGINLGDTRIEYVDRPVKILGPDTVVNTNSNAIAASTSPKPAQDNGLFVTMVLGLCAVILLIGGIVYLFVFKKM